VIKIKVVQEVIEPAKTTEPAKDETSP
ncbi:uncharacterized protein METZ01_LOCUS467155, partial [marine metagenome]